MDDIAALAGQKTSRTRLVLLSLERGIDVNGSGALGAASVIPPLSLTLNVSPRRRRRPTLGLGFPLEMGIEPDASAGLLNPAMILFLFFPRINRAALGFHPEFGELGAFVD